MRVPDATEAFRQFETIYLDQRYPKPIQPEAISDYLNPVLNHLFPVTTVAQIVAIPSGTLYRGCSTPPINSP